MMALCTAVMFPTTANHSIMTSIQQSSMPAISKVPCPRRMAMYWIRGKSVERTTRSALPSSPA